MKSILFFVLVLFVSLAPSALAGEVYFETSENIEVGDTALVKVKINTDKQVVNSLDMVVDFDENKMSFEGYREANSLIGMWIEKPNEKAGKIYLTGIIPGGVSGTFDSSKDSLDEVTLVELLFRVNKSGEARFAFDKSQVLKNDGFGSAFEHEKRSLVVNILPQSIDNLDTKTDAVFVDENPPEPFDVELVEASLLGRTPRMIVFNTIDPESGVKEYQVKKGFGKFTKAESPYIVPRKILPYKVTVRAYDYSGNYQASVINVPSFVPYIYLWIFLFLVSGFWAYKLLK